MKRPRVLWAAASAAAVLAAAPLAASAQAVINIGGGSGTYLVNLTSVRDMPFRTVVRQQYDYSCGSAALATLLRMHYRRPTDEAHVFLAMYAHGDQAKIRQVGFSLLDMKRYLASVGLASDGYRESLSDLQASRSPAIAMIKIGPYRHFVVIKGVRDGEILVGDPALGLKVYSLAEFAQVWSGVVFMIHAPGAFNQPDEWAAIPTGRTDAVPERNLANFTRQLPTIYQLIFIRPSP